MPDPSTPSEAMLLPCPFCGDAKPKLMGRDAGFVYCTNEKCGGEVRSPEPYHDKDAVRIWNTRAARPTGDAAELVGRLLNDEVRQNAQAGADPLCREAADLITRQQEQIGRLEGWVEDAYLEGYSRGMTAGTLANREEDWANSKARAASQKGE